MNARQRRKARRALTRQRVWSYTSWPKNAPAGFRMNLTFGDPVVLPRGTKFDLTLTFGPRNDLAIVGADPVRVVLLGRYDGAVAVDTVPTHPGVFWPRPNEDVRIQPPDDDPVKVDVPAAEPPPGQVWVYRKIPLAAPVVYLDVSTGQNITLEPEPPTDTDTDTP